MREHDMSKKQAIAVVVTMLGVLILLLVVVGYSSLMNPPA
jgi:hypothetical protein